MTMPKSEDVTKFLLTATAVFVGVVASTYAIKALDKHVFKTA